MKGYLNETACFAKQQNQITGFGALGPLFNTRSHTSSTWYTKSSGDFAHVGKTTSLTTSFENWFLPRSKPVKDYFKYVMNAWSTWSAHFTNCA